jgi:uncharacterized protein YdeI (YjbR/CyaY-like superfamily)
MTNPQEANSFYAPSRAAWRDWLVHNHDEDKSVWLILYKKDSGVPSLTYDEAVDEALCFGWVDSLPNKRDASSYYQRFSRRSAKSNWSAVNKTKVERLRAAGLMTEAGEAMVALAMRTGTWTALDAVEALTVPADLATALEAHAPAGEYFEAFPKSVKRAILEWINAAKKDETRAKRVLETATLAAQNIRANQYKK